MKILLIFENMYDGRGGRDLRLPVYHTSIINRSNATYSRTVPFFEAIATRLRLSETSPRIMRRRDDKPPVDLAYVRSACEYDAWDHIVTFGRKADDALTTLGVDHHSLPHPVSFQWRRVALERLIERITT